MSDKRVRATPEILIADDNEGIREQLQAALELEGYEVEVVATGEAAVERSEEGNYDLVVLDVVMPGMGGIEAMETLRRRHPHPPILMITGGASPEQIAAIERQGGRLMRKPITLSAFVSTVKEMLDASGD